MWDLFNRLDELDLEDLEDLEVWDFKVRQDSHHHHRPNRFVTVSYTHLTLPTIYSV